MIKPTKAQIYWSNKEFQFVNKQQFKVSFFNVNESNGDISLVPKFALDNSDIFTEIPANEPLKPTIDIILKAIEYGMLLQIDYKGAEDDVLEGHDRVIYPLVFGYSKDHKPLLRAYHFKGWSVSAGQTIDKEWRLFRFDRILNITFTGSFFRLAPEGYKPDDKGINDIVKAANFNDIRNLQAQLLNTDKIDLIDNVVLSKVSSIRIKDLNLKFKLSKPYEYTLYNKKDAKNTRMTFCKPLASGDSWIVIFGISIDKNKTFKVYNASNKLIGTFMSRSTIMANQLTQYKSMDFYKSLENIEEFNTYIYLNSN
jgi:hypothetical protein